MSRNIDTWDDEPSHTHAPISFASGSASSSKPKIPTPAAVRDDWEIDDEEEEDTTQSVDERNKQIWEDANTKVHHPMPSLVISRGSSISVTPSLPLNQPPAMRILKRPSPSMSPSQSSTNANTTGETFQEREARYQAARERIFGTLSEEASDNGDKKINSSLNKKSTPPTSPPLPSTKIVREPHGPTNANANGELKQENKGFGDRRAKRPPAPTASPSAATPNSSSDIPV